jgi:hypothetical protein
VLGWLTLYLPKFAYVLPAGAFLLSVLAQPGDAPRLPVYAVAWNTLLLGSSVALTMTTLYLTWNEVGSWIIDHVQGRYFLPPASIIMPVGVVIPVAALRIQAWAPNTMPNKRKNVPNISSKDAI